MLWRLIPLALLLLLCSATTAAAAVDTPAGDLPVFALEEEEPEAEPAAEEAEEECEETEEGVEECEEAEAASEGDNRRRDDCVLRSARAHARLDAKGKKLKLTIGYTAYQPVTAKIKIGKLGTLQRHLARSGVLRITKKVASKSGKRLVVTIDIPSARNAGCPSRRLVLTPR